MQALAVICAMGAAMAAGALFTFSTFTIRGLGRLPPEQGAVAMQAINREAPRAPFMLLLFGTGLGCLVLGVRAATVLGAPASRRQLVAAAIYLVGIVVLTGTYHVPRNNRLDVVDPTSADGIAYWATYLREWVPMNHVRTVASLATSALLIVSLLLGPT